MSLSLRTTRRLQVEQLETRLVPSTLQLSSAMASMPALSASAMLLPGGWNRVRNNAIVNSGNGVGNAARPMVSDINVTKTTDPAHPSIVNSGNGVSNTVTAHTLDKPGDEGPGEEITFVYGR